MPTVLRRGPYVFVFFSSDQNEPPHIHVKRNQAIAKFWPKPVSLAKNRGFKKPELKKIAKLAAESEQALVEAWHDYFGASQRAVDGGPRSDNPPSEHRTGGRPTRSGSAGVVS